MNIRTTLLATAFAGITALAACTTPNTPPNAGQAPHAGMMCDGNTASMDMNQMGSKNPQMMSGKSPEQQRAMMESQMKAMHGSSDPKMVEMHRQMMEKNCAAK